MKSSLFVVCCASLSWLYACNDIPQAPPEAVPSAPTSRRILIDSQFYADYSHAIVYPSLVLSGTTTFGLTYGLFEYGRYRFAGCPVGCEQRRNWVVGDPDTSRGSLGDYGASAAVDDRMETAYQLWTPAGSPTLKYASCFGLCQRSSGWSVTNVDTNHAGFFVSLAARFGATHIAYVTLATSSAADTGLGLHYAVCSSDCTRMDAWSRTSVDSGAYGETQIVIDPAGVAHIVYQRGSLDDHLRYARCTAACTTTANWRLSTIGTGMYTSLAVDANANLTLAYVDTAGAILRVATCAAGCASGVWTEGVVTTPESWVNDVALTVAPSGKLYMAYTTSTALAATDYGIIRLGRCTSECAVAASWHFVTVDSSERYHPWVVSLALDSAGHAGIAHANSYGMYFTLLKELP